MKKIQRIHLKTRHKILLLIYVIMAVVNALAWRANAVVDWYRLHISPLWTNTLARVMSVFPFSVGEILIYFGIFIIILAFLFALWSVVAKVVQMGHHVEDENRNTTFYRRFARVRKGYVEFVAWVVAWIILTETLNCFVFYHATTVEEQFFGSEEYGNEELLSLYEELITNANALSLEMQRDEQGNVVYDGDMANACRNAMKNLGATYPYLAGYYPMPKKIAASNLMSQQYLCGIYFPFTLESNYNTKMYIMNQPATICHELSHLKGVILEDEANYFGFLACIQSDDTFLQYSGYLSVLNYVAKEVKRSAQATEIAKLTPANDYVRQDIVFLTKESWDEVEKKAVVSTETANAATDKFLQSNLKANGVTDGMISYSRVVRLLLDYYDGILY